MATVAVNDGTTMTIDIPDEQKAIDLENPVADMENNETTNKAAKDGQSSKDKKEDQEKLELKNKENGGELELDVGEPVFDGGEPVLELDGGKVGN